MQASVSAHSKQPACAAGAQYSCHPAPGTSPKPRAPLGPSCMSASVPSSIRNRLSHPRNPHCCLGAHLHLYPALLHDLAEPQGASARGLSLQKLLLHPCGLSLEGQAAQPLSWNDCRLHPTIATSCELCSLLQSLAPQTLVIEPGGPSSQLFRGYQLDPNPQQSLAVATTITSLHPAKIHLSS